MTKIAAITNVVMNTIFSEPRRLALPVSDTSPPPNAPPTFASPCCRRIATISRIALVTCVACIMNWMLIIF